uniref:Uncharacterized protein n=1 Tax=Arundo donax TaxID=35708 RepID=A0A0A9EMD4_ARUDO
MAGFLMDNNIENQFHMPLSAKAFQEYEQLQDIIQEMQIQNENQDSWHYIWGSQHYSSKIFYMFPYKNLTPPSPFLWIWKSGCCNKLRVFS